MGTLTPILGQSTLTQTSASTVTQDSSIEGKLDSNSYTRKDGSYFNVYTFERKAGEILTIDLISDEFDAYLMSFDPDNNMIGENDNGGEGYNSKIVFSVPKTGTYVILVISKQQGELGNYNRVSSRCG